MVLIMASGYVGWAFNGEQYSHSGRGEVFRSSLERTFGDVLSTPPAYLGVISREGLRYEKASVLLVRGELPLWLLINQTFHIL